MPFIKYLPGIILAAYCDFESRMDLLDRTLHTLALIPSIGNASAGNSLKQRVKDGKIQRHGTEKSTFYTRDE